MSIAQIGHAAVRREHTWENQNTLCPTAQGAVPFVQPTLSGSITPVDGVCLP